MPMGAVGQVAHGAKNEGDQLRSEKACHFAWKGILFTNVGEWQRNGGKRASLQINRENLIWKSRGLWISK